MRFRRRVIVLGASVLLLAIGVVGAQWLFEEWEPEEMPEFLLEAFESVGIAFDTVDPDRPPHFIGRFDETEYLTRRFEYVALRRGTGPNGTLDPESRSRAVQAFEGAKGGRGGRAGDVSTQAVAWQELGPAPIPNGQTQGATAAVSGRVTAIEIHPTDPNVVYVGTAQGGVYRSTDGGANWTPIFDTAKTLAIGALALAPSDTSILYVGTGEANASCDSFSGVGLYRINAANTTATLTGPINPELSNNGMTQPVGAFTGRAISKIVVHPTSPGTIFVGLGNGSTGMSCEAPFDGTIPPLALRGLYRSTNATAAAASVVVERLKVSTAGGCFEVSPAPCTGNRNINDVVMDPGDPNTLVVWQNGTSTAGDGGIWRTTNALAAAASVTFTQTLVTTAPTTTTAIRGGFAAYKQGTNATVLYSAAGESIAGTGCATSGNAGALRRSTDGGATWSAKLSGGGGFCGGQCFYNIGLAASPGATTATSDDLVLLGGNVSSTSCARLGARSTDGAATFANNDTNLHADTHVIKFAPSNVSIAFHGNDGGIFKSTDGGVSWASLNNTQFKATQFESIAVHPTDQNFTLGGTQDNGTILRKPDGTFTRADGGDGGFSAIDQNATNTSTTTMYHTYFNQTNNLIGFARATNGVSAAQGSWTFFGCGSGATANGITCTDNVEFYAPLVLGPGNPNSLYFGTDRLYRSGNSGATATVISQVFTGNVTAVGIAKTNDNVRIVGLRNGGLFYTVSGSTALTDLDAGGAIPNEYVSRIVFHPTDPNTAFVTLNGYTGGVGATASHIWKITNLSGTPARQAINFGLPDVPVNSLVIDPSNTNRMFLGTDVGVYATADGGSEWTPYGTGLPSIAVFDLAIPPGSRILRIGTHGRGLWQASLDDVTATDDPRQEGAVGLSGDLYTGGQATFTINVKNYGTAATPAIHPYIDGNRPGGTWHADGAQPASAVIQPGATQTYTLTVAIPAGSAGTWQATSISLFNNTANAFYRALPANGQNQALTFGVGNLACTPTRPRITMSTSRVNANTLNVTLTAGATDQNNRLKSVRFESNSHINAANARITIPSGPTSQAPTFDYPLPNRPTTFTFTLTRPGAGASTIGLQVVDGCGSWTTFVGMGP